MAEHSYDTIVVGGGIAGLTAATYCARSGQKVLLIEKNTETGGLVNTFSRDGFHFDAGARAFLDAGVIFPMLKDLDIDLEVVKSPVSLGIEHDIIHITSLDSLAAYQDLLKKLYPDSDREIDETIQIIRDVMRHMDVLYGIENPVFKDIKHDLGFIFKKLLPWLPRFMLTVRKINRMNGPVEEYLKTIITDPSLRDIIAQHFFKNTPAFFALSYFSLYLDYFYPRGGMGTLAHVLKDKLMEFKGELKTETRITRVYPEKHLVQDEQQNNYMYENLVWAADLKTLYRIAEIEDLSLKTKTAVEDTKARMLRSRGGDSVFTLFLEVDEPLESFARIAHGHFFYTPSKQGLGQTHRKDLDDLLQNFAHVTKEQILAWLDRFISLNTFEISIPGMKDADLVPAGKTGVIISLLAEYDLFEKIRTAGWLDEFTDEIEDRMIRVISDSVYPMLKDKVIARFSFSPLSIKSRVGSSEGAITGWAFEGSMPVINKIHMADRSVLTPFPSLYQAGQWVYSPAGIPMSILTGKLAADRVLKSRK
jgi:phytoene dehydrogenase-like protein